MKITNEELEASVGLQVAFTFKPFIDPKCTEHEEILRNFGKAIDNAIIRNRNAISNEKTENIVARVKQTLTSLDYEKLTDYQAKCVLLLEKAINN